MPCAFLAVWLLKGAALPEGAIERVERVLPFHPDRADQRSNGDATLWSWRLDERLTGTEPWSTREDGAAAVAGYGIDPEGRRLSARELVDPESLAAAWARYHGEWSACVLGPGRLSAGSSAIGTEHVYLVQTPRFGAVATRARLLWALCSEFGEPLSPDLDTLASLLSLGYPFCTDGTAATAVSLVDATTSVDVETASGTCRLRARDPRFFVPSPEEGPVEWRSLARSAARNVAWLASTDLPIIAALTGGKDSRLVLSMIEAAGLRDRVERFSVGAPVHHADAIVAREIADRFALGFERTDPHEPRDLARSVVRHVAFTEGLLGAWDLSASTSYSPRIHMHGNFGEFYRGQRTTRARDPDRIAGELLPRSADFAGLLHAEVRAAQKARISGWLHELRDQGIDLAFSRDAFYLRQRVPRWAGQARLRAGLEGLHFCPLWSLPVLRAYWGLSADDRRGERVHFELMATWWRELLGMPFAEARWQSGMVRRSSVPDLPVPELRQHARPVVGIGWQVPALTRQYREIADRIEGHLDELDAIVARARVHDLLRVLEVVLGVASSTARWARAAMRTPVLLAQAQHDPKKAIAQTLALLTVIESIEALGRDRPAEVRVA